MTRRLNESSEKEALPKELMVQTSASSEDELVGISLIRGRMLCDT